jgi:cyclophilin family peptidyl-prolyl cis-trans isomerase
MVAPMFAVAGNPYSPVQAPVSFATPMMAPIAPGSSANGLYQGLAMLRQNMDTLLGQAAAMGLGSGASVGASVGGGSGNPQLASKLDQLSETFATEEKKLEDKVDTLETENKDMKKELTEQEFEIEALEARGKGKVKQDKAHKMNALATTRTSLDTYATEPWNATFKVHLDGKSSGREDSFTIRVHPEWAPEGAKRFQDIVKDGIFNDARFFRVVPGFMVQFGIPGDPKVAGKWVKQKIKDDPPKMSNKRGLMTFATSGPNTRTTQMFINYVDNTFLDTQGFIPFAEVLGDGMEIADQIQSKYKEKPNQGKIQHHGNKYLLKHFPELSFVSHVDASFPNPPMSSGGFLQDSSAPEKEQSQSLRYGGIATFLHSKQKVAD